MITLTFSCDGCNAEAKGTRWLGREFKSLSGRGYGFGSYRYDTAQDVAPLGWVSFDPYTGCTYCPECWAEIVRHKATAETVSEGVRP